ncbi:hypothetical protein BJ170DRAFT_417620 [Xylariales sp. AK1849]|nr:hypothetical protein BJ170DRAFT_417620 [Xylariales sp. AK1849]
MQTLAPCLEGQDASLKASDARVTTVGDPASPASRPIFAVKPSTTKGAGLHANQVIGRGTRIIAERPLLVLRRETPEGGWRNILRKRFAALSPADQDEFLHLYPSDCILSDLCHDKMRGELAATGAYANEEALTDALELLSCQLAIFYTNNAQMGSNGEYGSGIFPTFSRINHSCIPNASWTYNHDLGMMTVHAMKDILPEEEITITYVQDQEHLPYVQRAELLEDWGFKCDCPACYGTRYETHEILRQRIMDLHRAFADYEEQRDDNSLHGPLSVIRNDQDALVLAKEEVKAFKAAGILAFGLTKALKKCARYCVITSANEEAVLYLDMAYENECIRSGEDLDRDMIAYLDDVWEGLK